MKKYYKEIIILIIQIFMFYIFPMFAGPTDIMGMIVLMLLCTFILSLTIVTISELKVKYYYPLVVAFLFIPSIFIYYNSSAVIHILWYFVVSCVGILLGKFICLLISRKK